MVNLADTYVSVFWVKGHQRNQKQNVHSVPSTKLSVPTQTIEPAGNLELKIQAEAQFLEQ